MRLSICDICGQPTEELVLKLFLSNRDGRNNHAEYTHHMDVGSCCLVRVKDFGKWQKRVKHSNGKKRQQHPKVEAA